MFWVVCVFLRTFKETNNTEWLSKRCAGAACTRSCVVYALLGVLTGLQIQWLFSCGYRSRLREQYQLPEKPCDDCLVHCFCGHLALCQEYRELTNRGFDMPAGISLSLSLSIVLSCGFICGLFGCVGWHKNVEMQTRGVTTAPAVTGGMSR